MLNFYYMNLNNDSKINLALANEKLPEQPHVVNQVTMLSKYLALGLFILLPFIGAYIGYQLAPEKVVEVVVTMPVSIEKNQMIDAALNNEIKSLNSDSLLVDEVSAYGCTSDANTYPHTCFSYKSKTTSKEIKNLSDEAKAQGVISGRTALGELMYKTMDSSKIYFTIGIPESDACCRLIALDTDTLKFNIIDAYQGLGKSFSSKDRRYIANLENDTSLYILDLETEEIIQRKNITTGSLMSSKCGFAGPVYDVTFNESKDGFGYGVYGPDTMPDDECQQQKISEGLIILN